MRKSILVALVVTALSFAIIVPSGADSVKQFLTGFPGGNLATGINDFGWAVGSYKQSIFEEDSHGFIWRNGQVEDLGIIGHLAGINNSGTVVGCDRPTGEYENPQSFTCVGGQKTYLSGFDCPNVATAINDNGWITGSYGSEKHNFIWRNGEIEDLGVVGQLTGINNSGTVVGYDRPTGVYEEVQSFLLQNGTKTYLTGFSVPYLATGINDLGWVTGWYKPFPVGDSHGFIWRNGQIEDLGVIGHLTGINNSGVLVGYEYASDGKDMLGPNPRSFLIQPVPEPSSMLGLLAGVTGLAGGLRRRRKI